MQNVTALKTPYRNYRDFLIDRYGGKTYKLTVAGGRTCPTRDGAYGPKTGWGGCSFCDVYGSASYYSNLNKSKPVVEQLQIAADGIRKRYQAEHFIAYFQSYTSSYEEIDAMLERYEQAAAFPGVVSVAMGTRPDCLPDVMLDKIAPLLDRVDLQIELGVQSFQDATLEWFDRGHDVACAIDAIERLQAFASRQAFRRGRMDTVVHLIFGAPMESDGDIVEAARTINRLGVKAVKIHHLHVLKRTKLAARLGRQEFRLVELDEHLNKVALFLRHLSPDVVIHRTHAKSGHNEDLIGPGWSNQASYPVEMLRKLMISRGWHQGQLC